ncbi:maleylpyruvate isomerase family mycothiol-dependent enzyme [Mycobacterium shigaense]|uniref:Mycothiol-dependent maleylpyruvate isomerase metal-binding domain-containing protein n=1 Tax=Mycobacterium shigaense TaxID=722731 RepID=A0A1Z4EI61_9MYCO|nr:maleylpyruvate isomerase family mycothiol-dependent enzyme [Mycobacterium shigaense]PRI12722.1 hypothetical protein B2J96_24195 [Mycobacterium shigaense]BAX92659.1 hypothetical protein MSG_02515 [Mycobacterium shigaense]
MSHNGIKGMQAAGQDLLDAAGRLTDEQWRAPSAAGGWSVQDVFIHVGSLLELLQAAVAGAESPPLGVEELNEMIVAQRRSWTPSETVQFLRNQLDAAVRTFTPLQDEPAASTIVPMLDLGSYPVHAIVDMFTFDLTTHLHFDVLAPRGPVPLPHALDDVRLVPSVAWLLGGIPQMQPDLADHLPAPIRLRLTGPGGRDVVLSAAPHGGVDVNAPEAGASEREAVAATVTSRTSDFMAWSTQRLPWRELVRVDGDESVAAEFLNALNLI